MKIYHILSYMSLRYGGLTDNASCMIRAFKAGDYKAIAHCAMLLVDFIKRLSLPAGTLLLVVPSSTGKISSIHRAAKTVLSAFDFVDGVDWLQKRYPTQSFCKGAPRCATTITDSVAVPDAVAGRHVLLLDDVATTGTTMVALSGAIMAKGARSVTCLAVAKTKLMYK